MTAVDEKVRRESVDGSVGSRLRATERMVQTGFAVALFCAGVVGVMAYSSIARLRDDSAWVARTHVIVGGLDLLLARTTDAETGQRGFVITGDESFLEPYHDAEAATGREIQRLRDLMADDPARLVQLETLTALVSERLALCGSIVQVRQEQGFAAAQREIAAGHGKEIHDRLRAAIHGMKTAEEAHLAQREQRARQSARYTRGVIVAGGGISCVVAGLALLLVRRDFELRLRAERALRRSEENLAVTLQSIGDGVISTDRSGVVTRMNRVAEQLTGWPQESAVGRPVGEVFRIIDEETRLPADLPVERVLTSGGIHGLVDHTVLIARDGTERAIADSAAPIRDRESAVVGVVLVFRDVSGLRTAEQQLERFFNVSLDFLCIAKADGYFKRVSPAATAMLGWSGEELLSRPFLEFVHPEDRDATVQEVERQVVAGESVLRFENRYLHKDGSWRVLSWRSTPQPGGFMYATARDVTDLKRAEEEVARLNSELREHAARLEEANRELEAFSYSVSHDLRAPLRHVQGFAEMLTRAAGDSLSEKARHYIDVISRAGGEMAQLIDDLLAFSRMSRAELHERVVDLGILADEARRRPELSTADRDVRWEIGALPLVRADESLLRLVLINLLSNALKFSRQSNPATVAIGCLGREDGRVVIFVRDNGVGFDMAYADKLFGVFQRLHRPEDFEGTGIGLATVRRIISRHGGRVWAEAAPDRGATFCFTLRPAGPEGDGI